MHEADVELPLLARSTHPRGKLLQKYVSVVFLVIFLGIGMLVFMLASLTRDDTLLHHPRNRGHPIVRIGGFEVSGSTLPPYRYHSIVLDVIHAGANTPLQSTPEVANIRETLKQLISDTITQYQRGALTIESSSPDSTQFGAAHFAYAGSRLLREFHGVPPSHPDLLEQVSNSISSTISFLSNPPPAPFCSHHILAPISMSIVALTGIVPDTQIMKWKEDMKTLRSQILECPDDGVAMASSEWIRYVGDLMHDTDRKEIRTILERGLEPNFSLWSPNGEYLDGSGCNGQNTREGHMYGLAQLTVMMMMGYNSTNTSTYWELVRRGGWTTLLYQSPVGHVPLSFPHTALSVLLFEVWALKYNRLGRTASAGVFQKAAIEALKALVRWSRHVAASSPCSTVSSCNSNILIGSFLSSAILFCDDSIIATHSLADIGGFVVTSDPLNTVVANVNGTFLTIHTRAVCEPHRREDLGLVTFQNHLVESIHPLTSTTRLRLGTGVIWSSPTNQVSSEESGDEEEECSGTSGCHTNSIAQLSTNDNSTCAVDFFSNSHVWNSFARLTCSNVQLWSMHPMPPLHTPEDALRFEIATNISNECILSVSDIYEVSSRQVTVTTALVPHNSCLSRGLAAFGVMFPVMDAGLVVVDASNPNRFCVQTSDGTAASCTCFHVLSQPPSWCGPVWRMTPEMETQGSDAITVGYRIWCETLSVPASLENDPIVKITYSIKSDLNKCSRVA
eukprot:c7662_g1_i1.p1 GENE.c7662_g1_i1~~c7662_g1_i1.p1  ORF type:complete len:749 (+),score=163.38 c7662_g1_i1:49-2247(+)